MILTSHGRGFLFAAGGSAGLRFFGTTIASNRYLKPHAPSPSLAPPSGWWLEAILLALIFSAIRVLFSDEYVVAPPQAIVDLTTPRPFCNRVFAPLILHAMQSLAHLFGAHPSPKLLFALFEFGMALAVLRQMEQLIARGPRAGEARSLSRTFLVTLLLPLLIVSVLPIYYPWDIGSVLFWIVGLRGALEGRYGLLAAATIFGTLNRETGVLIPLLAVAVDPRKAGLLMPAALVGAGVAIRAAIAWATSGRPGMTVEWYEFGAPRLPVNLQSIAADPSIMLCSLGWLVALAVILRRRIPAELIRVQWITALLIGLSLVAGNGVEPRIFIESFTILYVACCFAAPSPKSELTHQDSSS